MTLQLCFRMFYLITKVLIKIAQSRIAVSASFKQVYEAVLEILEHGKITIVQ